VPASLTLVHVVGLDFSGVTSHTLLFSKFSYL
jgi:hypothetical protein